jgi:exonuclease III
MSNEFLKVREAALEVLVAQGKRMVYVGDFNHLPHNDRMTPDHMLALADRCIEKGWCVRFLYQGWGCFCLS